MFKMITFDIDGTLVQHLTNEISDEVREMFQRLKNKGYIVTLATGRDFNSIANIHKEKNIDFFIGANGSFIYDLRNNKYIFNSSINFDEFKKFNQDILMNNLEEIQTIILSDQKNVFILENHEKDRIWFWDAFKHKFKPYNKAESELDKNFFHLITIEHKIDSKILKLSQDFFKKNKMSISIQAHWPKGLFIANNNINKANAIKRLCKVLNIEVSEVIAFGDGENDFEMIKEVGLGVAMANANETLKKIADEVTLSVEDCGTKFFLEKKGII